MAITQKTRKLLWSNSGGLCAICKCELQKEFELVENGKSRTLIGEECHIISQQINGPRYSIIKDYDEYENLIILCGNDHKIVDENISIYTVDKLKGIKKDHELLINAVKQAAKQPLPFENFFESHVIKSLPHISSGKELLNIATGVHSTLFDYDITLNGSIKDLIALLLDYVTEWLDVFDDLVSPSLTINSSFEFEKLLNQLSSNGYLVFGEVETLTFITDGAKWLNLLICIKRKDDVHIINNHLVAAIANEREIRGHKLQLN